MRIVVIRVVQILLSGGRDGGGLRGVEGCLVSSWSSPVLLLIYNHW